MRTLIGCLILVCLSVASAVGCGRGTDRNTARPSIVGVPVSAAAPARTQLPARPLILVHYMPWFEADAAQGRWGWHWTMNTRDPSSVSGGIREIASHYNPLIGPYDSSDPAVLEYHTLLMRLSGIDGVVADWYGPDDLNDYASIHRSTTALIRACERASLGFAVCYEDQTIARFRDAGRLIGGTVTSHAGHVLDWLTSDWLRRAAYIHVAGKPLLMVFGPQGLRSDEWTEIARPRSHEFTLLTLHEPKGPAEGVFDWPLPQKQGIAETALFCERYLGKPTSADAGVAVPVAYPRFHDYYAAGKAGHAALGQINDDNGRTFRTTFDRASSSGAVAVQIATWNDWGEGTQIEPSLQHGYRDLEVIQAWRRELDAEFVFRAEDLQLPFRIYELRKSPDLFANAARELDAAVEMLLAGNARAAAGIIDRLWVQTRAPGTVP